MWAKGVTAFFLLSRPSQFGLCVSSKGLEDSGSSCDGEEVTQMERMGCVIQWTANFNISSGFSPMETVSIKRAR